MKYSVPGVYIVTIYEARSLATQKINVIRHGRQPAIEYQQREQ